MTVLLSNFFQMSEVILSGNFQILKSLGPRLYVADQMKTVLASSRSCLRNNCYVLLSVTKHQTTETTVICNGNGVLSIVSGNTAEWYSARTSVAMLQSLANYWE